MTDDRRTAKYRDAPKRELEALRARVLALAEEMDKTTWIGGQFVSEKLRALLAPAETPKEGKP